MKLDLGCPAQRACMRLMEAHLTRTSCCTVHKSEDLTRIFEGRHGPDDGTDRCCRLSDTCCSCKTISRHAMTLNLANHAQVSNLLQASSSTADTIAPPSVILAASLQHLRVQKRAMPRLQACHPSHALSLPSATLATTSSPATRCTVRSITGFKWQGAVCDESVAPEPSDGQHSWTMYFRWHICSAQPLLSNQNGHHDDICRHRRLGCGECRRSATHQGREGQ